MDCRVKPGNDGVNMAEESAKLRIPYLAAAQAQKHVTYNEAMTLLDTLVQLSVLDKDLTAPPGSPSEGDCYIVAGGGGTATDAWIGWETRVARFIDGEWRSYLPGEGGGAGWLAWVRDEDAMYRFDGADWTLAGIEGPQGPQGPAYQPDAAVDAIAGRTAYDGEDAAFSVLVVSDGGNGGQPTLYFKLSAASADWSAGITWLPETSGPAFTVRAATISAISIATGLNSGDTIDGVTLAAASSFWSRTKRRRRRMASTSRVHHRRARRRSRPTTSTRARSSPCRKARSMPIRNGSACPTKAARSARRRSISSICSRR
ncbi:MAG: hypothetical protein A49_23180 [Methyloceanibacter sp.]|nr:MAG: hypothetical protein A49_23180 [Methyloceanibacter sp.]